MESASLTSVRLSSFFARVLSLNRFKDSTGGPGGASRHGPRAAGCPVPRRENPTMSSSDKVPHAVADLIAYILVRFHETHRSEVPELVAQARVLADAGVLPELADHLELMGEALEEHMFKEEMRLFPMMEQGGGTLIDLLLDDLEREHRAHEVSIARLEELLAQLPATPGAALLAAGCRKFVDDLLQHVAAEDGDLFLRFGPRRTTAVGRVVQP
ncbi:regulator of cell morphogenesis and NO signaling [Rubrivivax gelatinosus IL144]|uniref:Regulator of cell morphogenesis and NO signaling n=2 Tax=Rubrivivax gelatinosus TaxID=28068 RepID=I0HM27_RUBGI|nr:regulator of cell morphogenesis and NO signaling [Rubrivivax gelatinosus IL144]